MRQILEQLWTCLPNKHYLHGRNMRHHKLCPLHVFSPSPHISTPCPEEPSIPPDWKLEWPGEFQFLDHPLRMRENQQLECSGRFTAYMRDKPQIECFTSCLKNASKDATNRLQDRKAGVFNWARRMVLTDRMLRCQKRLLLVILLLICGTNDR